MTKEKFKPDLSKVSINQLQQLTGSSYRTVKARLGNLSPVHADGNTLYFDPIVALPLIFEATGPKKAAAPVHDPANPSATEDKLDPMLQAARLSRARTKKVELETRVLEGELIHSDDVERVWSDMVGAFRAKILGLSTRVAPVLVGKDITEIQLELSKLHKEALQELSEYDPEQFNPRTGEESGEESGAAARSDGDPVG